jgi:hypothetical protein
MLSAAMIDNSDSASLGSNPGSPAITSLENKRDFASSPPSRWCGKNGQNRHTGHAGGYKRGYTLNGPLCRLAPLQLASGRV